MLLQGLGLFILQRQSMAADVRACGATAYLTVTEWHTCAENHLSKERKHAYRAEGHDQQQGQGMVMWLLLLVAEHEAGRSSVPLASQPRQG